MPGKVGARPELGDIAEFMVKRVPGTSAALTPGFGWGIKPDTFPAS